VFENLAALQELGGDPDLAGNALARAQAAEAVQDAREQREEEAKRARLAENAELRAIQNRALGDPLGSLRSTQLEAGDLGDRVRDLESQLERARAKLAANQERQQFWLDQVMVLEEGSARSATLGPMEQATLRAQDALRQAAEDQMTARQILRAARQQQRRGHRELASRSAPTAVLEARSAPAGHLSYRGGGEIVGVE
jgi:hypothetical protein